MAHRWYNGSWCSEEEADERDTGKFVNTLAALSLAVGVYLFWNSHGNKGYIIGGSVCVLLFVLRFWKPVLGCGFLVAIITGIAWLITKL